MADKKAGTQAGANDLVLKMVKGATPAAMFKAPAMPSAPKMPGAFSSMAVPTEELAKAQKPKPKKITPWEVRQDAVRVVGKASKLTTPEDYTLLDQFLYINRESKTGEKISPTQSKVTAPAFGVTQDAVNRARMLARTPEGRAKMQAEVQAFKMARAAGSAAKINEQFAPKQAVTPSLAASTLSPQQSKLLSEAAQAARDEGTFRTGTYTGRMIAGLDEAGKTLNEGLAPVTKTLAKAASMATPLGISPSYQKMTQALMVELPSGSLLAIPRGLVDLMATIDRDNKLSPEKRLQTSLGAYANLGGAVLGATTMADDVEKVSAALSNALRRGGKVVPAAETNAAKLLVKQGPPLPPAEPSIPQPSPRLQPETPGKLQAQNVQQQPRATEIVKAPNEAGSLRGSVGMGDQATGDKLLDAIGPFEWRTEVKGKGGGRVLYQVLVDSESGVELSRGGSKRNAIDGALTKIFGSGNIPRVNTPASLREAAKLGKQKMAAARSRFVALGGKIPETPTTAPVATPKAPNVQPAPIVAEKPPRAATQAIPESGGIPDDRYTKFRNDLETSPDRNNPNVYVPGKSGWEVTKKEWVALQPEPYQERAALGHESAVRRALSEGKPVPAEVLADYPDLAPKVSTTPPVSTAGKVADAGKPAPADASARATARADASFRAKYGVGLGDEVTVTYPNGKVQEGRLEHTAKTGWKIGNESVTPKTMTSIKPKAQAVETVSPVAIPGDKNAIITETPQSPTESMLGSKRPQMELPQTSKGAGESGAQAKTQAQAQELTPATGMEGLADRLAQRKAKLQDELAKAPKAIKGKQAGATFGPERLIKEVDLFLTSAAEAALRKGISLKKSIQELVMAEGRDAEDVAAINKALPKWADEIGWDDSHLAGKPAETAVQDVTGLPDVVTDAARIKRGLMPTSAPAASAERLAKAGVPAYQADTARARAMVEASAAEDGAVMDEAQVAVAAAYARDVTTKLQKALVKASDMGLSEEVRKAASLEADGLEAELGKIEDAAQKVKTKFHNLGEALQILLTPKFDFVSMKNRAMAANLGQNLSDVQTQAIRGLSDDVMKLESELADAKAKLGKMPATAIIQKNPKLDGAMSEWERAYNEMNTQKRLLNQVRKDTRSTTAKIKRIEARLKEKQDALAEANATLEGLQAQVPAAKSTASAGRSGGLRTQGIEMLKKLGVYKTTSTVSNTGGGMRSKQAGAVILPWGEKDSDSIAKALRMMIRGYADEATAAGNAVPTVREAIDMLKADPNLQLDEEQIWTLLSGQYRAVKLESDTSKLAGNTLIRAIKEDAAYRDAKPAIKVLGAMKGLLVDAPRALTFSTDLSALFNQGGKALLYGYAKEWGKSLSPMTRAIKGGDREMLKLMAEIQADPLYPRAVKFGLDITEAGNIKKAEEMFASGVIDNLARLSDSPNALARAASIPAQVVKRSEYAYTAFLNSLRFEMFKKLAKIAPNDATYLEDITDLINVVTGRGSLRSQGAKGAARAAANVVVAPRFYVSQMQDLVGYPLLKALAKGDSKGAGVAAKYYASKAAAYGLVLFLAEKLGWEYDNNPISNGFGTITNKALGTRVNVFGQDLQWIRPLAQMRYGALTLKGNYMSTNVPGNSGIMPALSMASRKFVPTVKLASDLWTGESYNFREGKIVPTTPQSLISSYLPISVRDTADAIIAKDPAGKAAAEIISNMLGIQVTKLNTKSAKKKPTGSHYKIPKPSLKSLGSSRL